MTVPRPRDLIRVPRCTSSRWLRRWGLPLFGVLLVDAVVGLLAARIAYGQLTAEVDARLADAGVRVQDEVLTLEREHLVLLRAIIYTRGLPEALAARDATALQRLVTPLQANADIPLVDVLDNTGMVVLAVRGEGAPAPRAGRAEWTIVQRALAAQRDEHGERQAALVVAAEGPLLATAGAVRLGDRIVGGVVVATPLADLIDRASGTNLIGITVYTKQGWPLATNLDAEPSALPASLAASITGTNTPSVPRTVSIAMAPHRELLGRLIVRREAAAVLGVAHPDNLWSMALTVALPVWLWLPVALVAMALLQRSRAEVVDHRGH